MLGRLYLGLGRFRVFFCFFPLPPIISGKGVGVSGQTLDIIAGFHGLVKRCRAFTL